MQHGTFVLIKQKQTVLKYYSLVNCIHVKNLLLYLSIYVNPIINVATTENTHYNIIELFDRSCPQKVISMWQDVWSNGKIEVHRSRKHTGNFLKNIDRCSIRVVDCSIRVC